MNSFWEKPLLHGHDYIIIGSGITGLSTAISLLGKQPKANVLVLERGLLPTGASTRNAGFVCFGSAGEVLYDINEFGEEKALNLVEMRVKGMKQLLQRLPHHIIEYECNGGYELLREGKEQILDHLDYLNKLLHPIIGSNVYSVADEKIHNFGFNKNYVRHVVLNPHEGQLHPGKMVQALQKMAAARGATILTGVEVTELQDNSSGVMVTAKGGASKNLVNFSAKQAAICTNAFAKSLSPEIDLVPGRGQVIVTSPIEGLPFKGTFHIDEGYYYFRNYGSRVVFGGGRNIDPKAEETTDIANTAQVTAKLEELLREIIIPGKKFTKEMEWSGIMGFTPDKRPVIKRLGNHIVCGVGLSGMGVAIGSELGRQLAEMLIES